MTRRKKLNVSVPRTWAVVKRLMEREVLRLHQQNPWAHRGDDLGPLVLRRHPAWRKVYKAAMEAGLPPEFAGRRPRRVVTTKDRAWRAIEDAARALVVSSDEVLTLRTAVARIVAAHPELYDRYARS
jgi:hypothetical protein